MDGVSTLGAPQTLDGSGHAALPPMSLPAGTHLITAVYAGNTTYLTSTSAPVTQIVNPASTTTALVSSLNPSIFKQPVNFTATVTSTNGPNPPPGTVTFKDGAGILQANVALVAGVASFTTSALNTGTHSITAVYNPTSDYLTSTSNTVSQVVNKASTSATVTSNLNPSTYGVNVTFTAKVTSTQGTPPGTVDFKDGGSVLMAGVALVSGQATFQTAALTGGAHSITVVYSGSANFVATTSPVLTQNVSKATPTSITVIS